MVTQPFVDRVEISRQIFDLAAAEIDVVVPELAGDFGHRSAGQREHLAVGIDADDPALRADDLRPDEADLAGA